MKVMIKPKEGLKIRRPDTQALLKKEGESVNLNTFWRRRLKDGDVIKVESGKVEAPKKQLKKEETK